ncbi:hypothetical protein [Methylophaga sp.]|uniref:hypothetical protein n=1 Tax=Methylophaga sp. TaxID=2024840 RepID=UPI003F6A4C59
MKINVVVMLLPLSLSLTISAKDLGLLEEDCFNEWKTRHWVLGEDKTPAHQVPRFAAGIKQICETRVRLFKMNSDISPYIQGRLAEVAPYVFSADQQSIEALIMKLEDRPSGPRFSGSTMRD